MNILISAYTGMGNMILKTPMIAKIHQLYSDAKLDLVAGNTFGAEAVMAGSKYINQVFLLNEDNPAHNKNIIMSWHHDYCLASFDAAPKFLMQLLRESNVKNIVRHYLPTKNPLQQVKRVMQKKVTWVPLQAGRHEIDLNFDLLTAAYGKPLKHNNKTYVAFEENDSILKKYEIASPYIVIQPGAANGIDYTKIWPADKFIALIDLLLKNYGHQIILVGDKRDYKDAAEHVVNYFENDNRVINTIGATNINELKNLLFYSKLIICHDSGIMHLADALEKQLLAFFGPSDFDRVKPMRATSHHLFSKTKYLNAKYNFKPFTAANLKKNEPIDYAMKGLAVAEVFNKVKSLL